MAASYYCPKCEATADAPCNCGVPLLPAAVRAAEAIAANPEMSDRAIAAEIGVSAPTVGKARKSTVSDFTVEKRVGADGKSRRLPQKPTPKKSDKAERENYRTAFWLRADAAIEASTYDWQNKMPVSEDEIAMARRVVAAWEKLVTTLQEALK